MTGWTLCDYSSVVNWRQWCCVGCDVSVRRAHVSGSSGAGGVSDWDLKWSEFMVDRSHSGRRVGRGLHVSAW